MKEPRACISIRYSCPVCNGRWVIGWHILLPAFTVGLASFVAVSKALYLSTGGGLPQPLAILAPHLRGLVRHGRGDRHRHAVPVRHQLGRFSDAPATSSRRCWPMKG